MNYDELSSLIALRASQAYAAKIAAQNLPPRKRQAALDKANRLQSACEIASEILGENTTDRDKEERIKGLFLQVICEE